jgi:hypothetical protein
MKPLRGLYRCLKGTQWAGVSRIAMASDGYQHSVLGKGGTKDLERMSLVRVVVDVPESLSSCCTWEVRPSSVTLLFTQE